MKLFKRGGLAVVFAGLITALQGCSVRDATSALVVLIALILPSCGPHLQLGDEPQVQASSGDITAVLAGLGLSGGATSGDATLDVDPTVIQQRVAGGCATNEAIRTVNQDGTVVCQSTSSGLNPQFAGVTNVMISSATQETLNHTVFGTLYIVTVTCFTTGLASSVTVFATAAQSTSNYTMPGGGRVTVDTTATTIINNLATLDLSCFVLQAAI